MNKRIDFSQNGGFPATQYTLNWMQDSFRKCFMALAGLIGDKVIVSGCQIVGAQTTDGWISYNGELIPFIGGVTIATFVIEELNETRLFNDNTTKPVYYTKQARFGNPGINFSDLKRQSAIIDFFTAFNTLTTNFNAFVLTANASIADIYSRLKIIYTGTIYLGDIPTDELVNVVHNQGIASPYLVVGTLVSLGADYNQDNDVIWMTKNPGANNFYLTLRDVSPNTQNLRFDYAIILK